ncbi:hypothetical protein [Agromyces protaetiae]|uniref:hypothetical protein n=1 Tax=Agromyces protaetiae TaxID=2509455 RepID=UPI001FB6FD24|nr:hypothetical protein [Agromyces protaetiae]
MSTQAPQAIANTSHGRVRRNRNSATPAAIAAAMWTAVIPHVGPPGMSDTAIAPRIVGTR